MSIHYKYNIGDEVRLTKRPSDFSSIYPLCRYDKDFSNETFKINGWGWTQKEPNIFEKYYRIEPIKSDNRFLNYHNRILEEELEPVGEVQPFDDDDLVYKSVNGDEIKLGMTGYYGIYYGGENDYYIVPEFTFTEYGEITEIWKFFDGYAEKRVNLCVLTDKKFNKDTDRYELYSLDENQRTPAVYPYLLLTNPKSGFADEFVDTIFSKRNSKIMVDENHRDYYIVHAWLEHMGILDEVMELYNKRKNGCSKTKAKKKEITSTKTKKTSNRKEDKLSKLLEGLSEDEKKKLREML